MRRSGPAGLAITASALALVLVTGTRTRAQGSLEDYQRAASLRSWYAVELRPRVFNSRARD